MHIEDEKSDRSKFISSIREINYEASQAGEGWDFKQHVLGTLFYCYVSAHLNSCVNAREKASGDRNFNYSKLSDDTAEQLRSSILAKMGYFILPSELFANVRKNAAKYENLERTLESIFRRIEFSSQDQKGEYNLQGLFGFITNKINRKGNASNEILRQVMDAIGDLSNCRKRTISENLSDAFGYLVKNYPSKLNYSTPDMYFTPVEFSELMVGITVAGKKEVDKVYDPTCGIGEILLSFANVLGRENIRNGFFGQDISNQSYNLCRINMILHDIKSDQLDIACGDTLSNPHHSDVQPFESIVSYPTYCISWEGESNPRLVKDVRFSPAGEIAPARYADWAFVLHSLAWLADNGTAAIILMLRAMDSLGEELSIRKYLIENNYVDAVIRLPYRLRYGTPVPCQIVVIKKNKSDNKVLFIDAMKEVKTGVTENWMEHDHIKKVLDCYMSREKYSYFSLLIDNKEIAENNYDFSVEVYLKDDIVDITKLNAEITDIVSHQGQFRKMIDATLTDFQVGVE